MDGLRLRGPIVGTKPELSEAVHLSGIRGMVDRDALYQMLDVYYDILLSRSVLQGTGR